MLLWLPKVALAQTTQVLRGQVIDAETHQPIPNAQVGVANNRIGTSTNEDGRFALSVPAALLGEQLEVALLGYRKYTRALPPLPGPELRVELRISPAALGEVQVTGSVLGIVKEAIARIPRNYPTRPTQLTGFYRESDNDPAGQPRYLAEGLVLAFKESYLRRTAEGEIQIKQSRKVDLRRDRTPIRIDWAGGPFIAHMGDFVHRRSQFIDPAHFKDYDYRLAPGSTFQDRPVYVITFGPKNGNRRAALEGRMYIEQDSYAFLGAEWHYTPAGLNHGARDIADSRSLRVAYQPYAGRWHLKTVWWQTEAKLPVGPPLKFFGEFLTTAIDTAQTARPSYLERAQLYDVFLRNTVAYDSAFWQGHTTLLPPAALQKSIFDQQRQQQADSLFKPSEAGTDPQEKKLSAFDRFLKRFSYGSHLGAWPLAVPAAGLTVAYAPAGYGLQMQRAASVRAQDLTVFTQFEYQYALTRELAVSVATQRLHRQFKGDGWEVGLSYQHNLTPRHRPLYGRAGLGYLRQTTGLPLGTFDNPDSGLRVAGTHLGADELSARIQTVSDFLRPSLGLGLELSHRFELVADASYLVPLSSKTQLQLDEESGFFLFRSSSTVDLPAADVDLRVNDQPTTRLPWQQQPWLLTLGLRYRVR
ncbi:carboxypeptidase-like regulatory domain-containing protein [Hymenobacter properus]|uniref:Carboxypeptidase-like regulatory domain-containing protein n=1 Tax=Hymenobacter properus TaxID=2791026 RepID=A0A931BFZ3_9BACT|nr:carboxypeptidase-like regulatory domain-containing protein [Hymenobacter properus]MBF9143210.1 carboxypeptidase-like regulatory domain-containing protein [Hymenobacter properus]MBR7722019.1 carboxypeptidase-like regulatory domain-containing protein [Microvirga sp. SRT04]